MSACSVSHHPSTAGILDVRQASTCFHVRLAASVKENRYPNFSPFAAELRKADVRENNNVVGGAPLEFDISSGSKHK